jgi:Mn2+/Fe2+ NRAMP family transporter
VNTDPNHDPAPRTWREPLRQLGPGLITGAADDDPSGSVATTVHSIEYPNWAPACE